MSFFLFCYYERIPLPIVALDQEGGKHKQTIILVNRCDSHQTDFLFPFREIQHSFIWCAICLCAKKLVYYCRSLLIVLFIDFTPRIGIFFQIH